MRVGVLVRGSVMKVKVGQGSCGIAIGAKKVVDSIDVMIKRDNLDVDLEVTGCVGTCFLEPIVDVYDDEEKLTRYVNVKPEEVESIFKHHFSDGEISNEHVIDEEDEKFITRQQRIVLRNCGLINPEKIEDYINEGGYEAARIALTEKTPEEVIEEIKKSGLRGRGGAGFPTWFKWNVARSNDADQKYIVCNADEGDPGAFMDRSVLEGDPHALLEGMLIGGYAIGATKGVIYVRAEYPLAIKRLENAMEQARKANYLGDNILGSGFDFDLYIKAGAGAFVCGEETAWFGRCAG